MPLVISPLDFQFCCEPSTGARHSSQAPTGPVSSFQQQQMIQRAVDLRGWLPVIHRVITSMSPPEPSKQC